MFACLTLKTDTTTAPDSPALALPLATCAPTPPLTALVDLFRPRDAERRERRGKRLRGVRVGGVTAVRARRLGIAIAFILMRRAVDVFGTLLFVGPSAAEHQWHFGTPGGSGTVDHTGTVLAVKVRGVFWAMFFTAVLMIVYVIGQWDVTDKGQDVVPKAFLAVFSLVMDAGPSLPFFASELRF